MNESDILSAAEIIGRKRAVIARLSELADAAIAITHVAVHVQTDKKTSHTVSIDGGNDLRAPLIAVLEGRLSRINSDLRERGVTP